ncbi:MAG: TonB-dependent receptor [Acidobacteria bacterium]|nr:TonB-dependent receptor [Acidobacteriota bacterium]
MHSRRIVPLTLLLAATLLLLPVASPAQSFNGYLSGTVVDPSGSPVADATMVLRNTGTGVELTRSSEADGSYAFPNLVPGTYELTAEFAGFEPFVRRGIAVAPNGKVRLDVGLALAGQTETIEVVGASAMNYDSGSKEDGIAPETLNDLPLVFNSGPRSSATFVLLMPGVSSGGSANAFDARINGGLQSGDEAVLDGASMQQGFMSQSGMVSIFQDFPYSPDMVSEIKVVSSSYDAQYGSTTGGQIVAVTKSGQENLHGALFWYAQRDGWNANQWGATEKSPLKKNNFGGALGGPMKIPGLWSNSVKTYFYADVEGYRQEGGSNRPTLSIPSMAARNGDFSNWRDASGNLIPIYDPATLQPDGSKQQFPGNIIPADRFSPVALGYLQYLPTPTNGDELNNYLVPSAVPDSILGDSNYFFGRFDSYIGQNDHISVSLWHQRAAIKYNSLLPSQLATEDTSDPQNSSVNRLNWDHTFGANLLNHLTFGYLNRNEGYGCVNTPYVNDLPKIQGVVSNLVPSPMNFSDGYNGFGCGGSLESDSITTRPTYVLNDLVTWIKGNHTIKIGGEYRNIGGNLHSRGNEQGTFNFGRGATGIAGVNSGNPIASFLLGAVDNANLDVRTASNSYPRQHAWIFHAGDTWNATSKLTVNYGLRWDYYSPSSEKYDRLAFLDPTGTNPSAPGYAGSLAYAGTEWGAASYGARYPEKDWYGGFAPRLGLTYALNPQTLVRAGWGLFYDRAFIPGWGGGMSQDGFNSNVSFSSSLNGVQPAFYIDNGFPQDYVRPPFITADFRNGSGLMYRTLDGNERPRSQQWNLTIDREISPGFTVGLAYVGSRGTRVPSSNQPLNALDPAYLSLGAALDAEFEPGMTSLNGVPLPYEGWVEQMTSCAPTVAQALLPYPQYCSNLQGLNENHGKSSYHSLQAKVEKRFSRGTYFLVSYTLGRIYTSGSDNTQSDATTWSGASGSISPYEQERNRALAVDDVTHVLSAALVWDLPIGQGKRYMDTDGVANAILGGWQLSSIFRYSSGIPFFFRSGYCNVPGQFRAACIPSISGDIFAQDFKNLDVTSSIFNRSAFESPDAFNYYYGNGERVTSYRKSGYRNMDLSLIKNTRLFRDVNLQLRFEAFNVWNWHNWNGNDTEWGSNAFNTDVNSPDFGLWNGAVTSPRVIQLAARIEF